VESNSLTLRALSF